MTRSQTTDTKQQASCLKMVYHNCKPSTSRDSQRAMWTKSNGKKSKQETASRWIDRRPTKHITGHIGDWYLRVKWPNNSGEALKEEQGTISWRNVIDLFHFTHLERVKTGKKHRQIIRINKVHYDVW